MYNNHKKEDNVTEKKVKKNKNEEGKKKENVNQKQEVKLHK